MAAEDSALPEIVISELPYQEPPIDSGIESDLPVDGLPVADTDLPMGELPETGGLDPVPVPYELGEAEGVPEPEVTDIVVVTCDFTDLPLPEDPTRIVYYSLGGEGFDPTVIRNFGLEEDPAAAALERIMTKAIDQAADKAVQPLSPAPL